MNKIGWGLHFCEGQRMLIHEDSLLIYIYREIRKVKYVSYSKNSQIIYINKIK